MVRRSENIDRRKRQGRKRKGSGDVSGPRARKRKPQENACAGEEKPGCGVGGKREQGSAETSKKQKKTKATRGSHCRAWQLPNNRERQRDEDGPGKTKQQRNEWRLTSERGQKDG